MTRFPTKRLIVTSILVYRVVTYSLELSKVFATFTETFRRESFEDDSPRSSSPHVKVSYYCFSNVFLLLAVVTAFESNRRTCLPCDIDVHCTKDSWQLRRCYAGVIHFTFLVCL